MKLRKAISKWRILVGLVAVAVILWITSDVQEIHGQINYLSEGNVLAKPCSYFQEHPWQAFGILAFLLMQTAAIIVLLVCQARRKKGERSLQESRLLSRTILSATHDIMLIMDEMGTIIDCNTSFLDYAKATREEMIGSGVFDQFGETETTSRRAWIRKVIKEQTPAQFEDYESISGKYFQNSLYPLATGKGEKQTVLLMAQDITQRKEAEMALRKSEQLARSLLNATNDVTHLLDEDGTILDLNDAMAAVLGETREALIGTCVYDFFPHEAAEVRRTLVRQALAEERPVRYIDRNRAGIVFDAGIYPIKTPAGDKDRVVVFAHDITERELAATALKESEEKFRSVMDQSPDPIVLWHPDGTVAEFNQAWIDIWQISGEILPEVLKKYTILSDRQLINHGLQPALERAFSGERVVCTPVLYDSSIAAQDIGLDPAGFSKAWIQLAFYPVKGPNDSLKYVVGLEENVTASKEAEIALRESEEKFRRLVENVPDVVWTSDIAGNTVYISDDIKEVYGYSHEEIYRSPHLWFDRIHPEDVDRVRQAYDLLFQTGKPFDVEYRIRHKEGHWLWLHDRSISIYQKDDITYADGLFSDITFRKQAEQDLQKSRDYLEHLINSIPDAVFSVSLPERTIQWAKDSYNVLGHNLDQFIGKTTGQIYSSEEQYQIMGELTKKAIRDKKDSFLAEALVRNNNGEVLPVEINTTIYRDKGEPVSATALVRDISSRKEMELALKKSEERLRHAQEIAGLGYWEWDLGTDQLTWSDEVYRIYGIEPGTPVTSNDLSDCVHPDDREHRRQLMNDLLAGKMVPSFNYRIVRTDGSVRYIYGMKQLQRDDRGAPFRIKGTLQDITESKTVENAYRDSEARLKQAQAEAMNLRLDMAHLNRIMTMNELAASFAHELNQPLGAITNNATVAKTLVGQFGGGTEDFEEILDDISSDALRAGQIIHKIRGIMQRGDTVYSSLDVNKLLDEVIGLYQNTLSLNHVSVVIAKDPDLAPVKGDQIRLQQVLMNLITNGMESMAKSPRKSLEFKTIQTGNMVKVSISDSGSGIEQGYIDHIFDPFYTTKSEGMGIGLRLCRSIIEEHGGRIWAENNDDAGVTFFFTLKEFS